MTPLIRIALAAVVLALPTRAFAASCPTDVLYEPTGPGSVDAGWNGLQHDLPILGPTLHLAVDCGPTSPPCGTCAVTGIVGPRRCAEDTAKACTLATEVADCGAPASCRVHLAPPQSIRGGFFGALCFTTTITGSAGGTIDVESGAFAPTIALQSQVYGGIGAHQGCPRCVGDPVANDGIRFGSCDAGPRAGLDCDANAASGLADFGSTSFDCPPPGAPVGTFRVGPLTASTGTLTRTLGPLSPRCPAFGGLPCFCGTCNNLDEQPCFTNTDCPLSGGNPGICGGRRCIGGSNAGAPCTVHSECPLGLCNQPGEPARPDACFDDTLGVDCVFVSGTEGECIAGPIDTFCSNHPNRQCSTDGDCDGVSGACMVRNRPCFPDNGADGASISVSGTATPPLADVAEPTDLAVLACAPPSGSSSLDFNGGFPGLVRASYPGRLRILDPAATPTPTATPPPTITPPPTPIPDPCSGAPASCRPPFVSGKSTVQLTDKFLNDKDRLQWKWNKGSATSLADFGDPVTSDEYALCLYNDTGLRGTLVIPPGGTCNGKPCWRATSKGFEYKNNVALPLPDGITRLVLRPGPDGRAGIQAQGRGAELSLPPLDVFTGTLRLQLRNRTTGLCWDATFPPPFQLHNDERLKAKGG